MFSLVAASVSQASVTTCQGVGVTASNYQYGRCATDKTGGSGTFSFNADGLTASVDAKTMKNAYETASYWASNGSVGSVSSVCISLAVGQLDIKRSGYVQQHLLISYNGSSQLDLVSSVLSTGTQPSYCAFLPAGANNVWWQLVTVVGGDKPSSQMKFAQTLLQVTVA